MSTIEKEIEEIKSRLNSLLSQKIMIALFGDPGAGKSSIINKLIGHEVAQVGVHTDTTTKLEKYDWNGLHLVDLPGFDTEKFPKESFFAEFGIEKFDLFLCVFEGKFRETDSQFFNELVRIGKVCIFVRNKRDMIWQENVDVNELMREIETDTNKMIKKNVKVFFTSCRNNSGISELSQEILDNLDSAKKEKWARTAKAYSQEFLDEKYASCEKIVYMYSGIAATNAINPVPGLDVAVDLGTLLKMFHDLREAFGLTDVKPDYLKEIGLPTLIPIIENIIKYATKEGLILLLKKFAGREAMKQISKYIPFVGQVIAASIGFAITLKVGKSYLDDCYNIAKEILNYELKQSTFK